MVLLKSPPQLKSYPILLNQIKHTITQGRKNIEHVKALTYWKIGENISKHLLNQNGHAGYGKQLYINLSRDLNVDRRTLYQLTRFYKQFSKVSARSKLGWTHYRKLISVDDPLLRNRLLKKARKNNLTTRQLAKEIRHATYDVRHTKSVSKLIPKRGQPYIYRLIDIDGTLEVDCGFHVTRAVALTGLASPKDKDLVISEKTRAGFTFSPFEGSGKDLYTYKAGSIRVIDGDTLSCRVDCGFRTKVRRSLRLRGINAPELTMAAGQGRQALCPKKA